MSVILVEPQSPGNIGMVCRAMKNMGLSKLRLVKGCRHDHPEARKFAVSARDVLENAEQYDTLNDALSDCEISVATTRRLGKYRQEVSSPEEIVAKLESHPATKSTALVFGREDSGLTNDELVQCTWLATIPSADEYGSLNLAQAVLVFCYELFRSKGAPLSRQTRTMAYSAELEAMYCQMEETLLRIGFLNPQNPSHLMLSVRRIFARAELDSREVAILRGMMSQIDWAYATSPKGKL
ncbi:MAG: RNA methyltransferase [Deltaproteobacteria bacterium]